MYGDRTPIEVYVSQAFQNPRVMTVIANWRVESKKLQDIAVNNFREMGLFFVEKYQRPTLLEALIFTLRRSPDVLALKKKAENEENERKRTRHADI